MIELPPRTDAEMERELLITRELSTEMTPETSIMPLTESPDPRRANCDMDWELANPREALILMARDAAAVLATLTALPVHTTPVLDRPLPSRANDRTDPELPRVSESSTDPQDPIR